MHQGLFSERLSQVLVVQVVAVQLQVAPHRPILVPVGLDSQYPLTLMQQQFLEAAHLAQAAHNQPALLVLQIRILQARLLLDNKVV